jgi:amidase
MTIVPSELPSAREITALIAKQKISPVEAVMAAIQRIEARNPSINAVIFCDFDGALSQAHALEQRIMRGEKIGPLAGLPTLMKDMFDFRAGWPTTFGGIPALRNFVPNFTSIYPKNVERDGGIVLGKTNGAVMGSRVTTDNPLFGPTANPFDTTRNSGGSSGGSGAAVADGLVSVAGASDGGGSARVPASWCGVAGFHPSFGRVPVVGRPNGFFGISPFLYQGLIARTVDDLALVMNTLAGHDPLDPFSSGTQIDYLSALEMSIKGKRIAFTSNFGCFPVEQKVANCVAEAMATFELVGARVDPIDFRLPLSHTEVVNLWYRLISAGNRETFEGLKAKGLDLIKDHRDELPDHLVYWIDFVSRMTLSELQQDQVMRTQIFDAFAAVFETFDLIVSPTTAILPVKNLRNGQTTGPRIVNGVEIDPHVGWSMTSMTNMIGHPASSVPAGLVDGLPVGLQIIGRRYGDIDVMSASAEFERARPWKAIYDIPAKRQLS